MKSGIGRLCLFLCALPLAADISFLDPDINGRNEILFTVRSDVPGHDSSRTLFLASVDPDRREQLTFYPESLEALSGGSILQIRNRFGTGRFDTTRDEFALLGGVSRFESGGPVSLGDLAAIASSPDGRWLATVEPVSPARGRLVLLDVASGARRVIAESVERGPVPVTWAPDSSVLVYCVSGTLYFARPASLFSTSSVSERFRTLGPGTVACVSWFDGSRFLYVSGKTVYRVQTAELFARSLYSPLIGVGDLAGKLPCEFSGATDSFCAAPDGSSVMLARERRSVYYCPLEGDDYSSVTRPDLLPYLLLPGNTSAVSFAWTEGNTPAAFAESIQNGRKVLKAWMLSISDSGRSFVPLALPADISSPRVSPDGANAFFIVPSGLLVYSTAQWKEVAAWKEEPVVSAAWGSGGMLYLGGTETVRKWNWRTGGSTVLLLSQVASAAWDEQGTVLLADTTRLGRFRYAGSGRWTPAAAMKTRPASGANASWRVYVDSNAVRYENMLYIRSATSPGGTRPLVPEPSGTVSGGTAGTAGVSSPPGISSSDMYTHGARNGIREVALVFDAMDSLDGLPVILQTLDRYRIRATFFINGEFIRQQPAAVNEIVKSGHQTASLFFTTWDLSGTQYRIDEDFIVRGLSRNEDDFYNATGSELTLLWHAPWYVTSPMIIGAGKKAGYRYVGSDVKVLDWVTKEQDRVMPGLYRSAADLVDDIVSAAKPGSIIPVRIGKVPGERDDWLYEKIDLLVNALTEQGYRIVTVDTLIRDGERQR